MKVTMFWHGGPGYSVFDVHNPRDAEMFGSLADAKRAFASRVWDNYYPCVEEAQPDDGGPEAWLFLGASNKHPIIGHEYPDRIMRFGRRGGVVVERV
jgi:hypothetical protein